MEDYEAVANAMIGSAPQPSAADAPAATKAAPEPAWVWQYYDGAQWKTYNKVAQDGITFALSAGLSDLEMEIGGQVYTLDLQGMVQRNVATQHARMIRKVDPAALNPLPPAAVMYAAPRAPVHHPAFVPAAQLAVVAAAAAAAVVFRPAQRAPRGKKRRGYVNAAQHAPY